MCKENSTCIHPENLKGEPKDCSAEQIAICHPVYLPWSFYVALSDWGIHSVFWRSILCEWNDR
jgi:hypothetical protein